MVAGGGGALPPVYSKMEFIPIWVLDIHCLTVSTGEFLQHLATVQKQLQKSMMNRSGTEQLPL